jgi:Tol biopolymer transport system component
LGFAIAGVIFFFEHRDSSAFTTITRITQTVPENRATAAGISPDGKFVSYANSDGVFIQSLKRGEPTILKGPSDFNVDTIAWLPDGTKVIASGFSDEKTEPEIWSIPINGGAARELRTNAYFAVPSPDGSQIVFVNSDYSSVGTMDLDGQASTTLLQLPLIDTIRTLLWSSDGQHLVIQRRHLSSGVEQLQEMDQTGVAWSLDTFDMNRRKITSSRANRPNRQILSLASLPHNSFAFVESDTGSPSVRSRDELFSVRMDPNSGRLSSVATPLSGRTLYGDRTSHDLSSSGDGKKVALLRQTVEESIFVANFNRAALHFSNLERLTLTTSPSFPHAWTPDSEMIIFESDRTGSFDLFKQRVDRRLPESILSTAKHWEYLPQLTPDAKYILFASTPTGARPFTLMRIPAGGGVIEEVPIGGQLDEFRCSVRPGGRCVLRKTIDQSQFVYYELDPVRGIGKELARTSWLPPLVGDWDVSPDGKFVAIPIHDRRSANVRVVPLAPLSKGQKQHEVVLPGLTHVGCLAWLTDGTGWFVNTDSAGGGRMYFSTLDGRLTPLGDIESCAVPSPDGTKVAFHHNVIDSNVWVLTGNDSSSN